MEIIGLTREVRMILIVMMAWRNHLSQNEILKEGVVSHNRVKMWFLKVRISLSVEL